jgi:N-methylhydantoinase A
MACYLASELGVKEVVIPQSPGTLSALGGLIADLKNDFLKTVYMDLDTGAMDGIRKEYAVLTQRALEWLRKEQGDTDGATLAYSAEMRYRGQSFEIETPLGTQDLNGGDVAALAKAFHQEHRRIYGHADAEAPVQVVSLRVLATGRKEKPSFKRHGLVAGTVKPERFITVWMDGGFREVALYARAKALPGMSFEGPSIVAQDDTTTVILPGYRCAVDEYSNLRISRKA